MKSGVKSVRQSRGLPPRCSQEGGSHGEPHAQPALCWRRLESTVSPTTTWQTPSQQCIPTGCANVSTKPRGLGPSRLPELSRLQSRKLAVSSDHLPPTSAARTTKRARPLSPASSGSVLSFFLRASSRAAPLWSAALLRAVPSRLRGDTNVGSVKEGQPVHDNLQPPCVCWIPSMTFVETRPPPSLQTCAAARSSVNPPCSQDPRLRARCSMVATAVEETATSAGTGGERQWEVEVTTQQNPERLWIDPR